LLTMKRWRKSVLHSVARSGSTLRRRVEAKRKEGSSPRAIPLSPSAYRYEPEPSSVYPSQTIWKVSQGSTQVGPVLIELPPALAAEK
jgi:hypothetical protein